MPHLPKVPEHFVKMALAKAHAMDGPNYNLDRYNSSYLDRQLIRDGKTIGSRYQYAMTMDTEWEAWVDQNIMQDYHNTGVRVSVGRPGDSYHGAHVDSQHDPTQPTYKLYYLLDRGGDAAETCFYWEKGQPIERSSLWGNPTKCDDYSKLEIMERVRLPMQEWVLLNTGILHGVENVTGSRVNLTVVMSGNQVVWNCKFKKGS